MAMAVRENSVNLMIIPNKKKSSCQVRKVGNYGKGFGNTPLIPKTSPSKSVKRSKFSRSIFNIHLDYLRVRCTELPIDKLDNFLNYCINFRGDKETVIYSMGTYWAASDKSIRYFNKFQSANGLVGGFNINEKAGTVDVMVDFTGKYFQGKTAIDIWRIIRGLYNAYGCHCCRIDIAIDDPTYRHIPVDEMVQAINDGNKFYFRTYDHRESETDGKITHAMGSRKSDHYTRIYDHKGQFLRHETEFKGKYAQEIFETIADIKRDWFNNLSTKGSQVEFNEEFPTTPCDNELNNWLKRINTNTEVINLEQLKKLAHRCENNFDKFLQAIWGSMAVIPILKS